MASEWKELRGGKTGRAGDAAPLTREEPQSSPDGDGEDNWFARLGSGAKNVDRYGDPLYAPDPTDPEDGDDGDSGIRCERGRYGDEAAESSPYPPGTIFGVPKAHVFITLAILGVVGLTWLCRDDVRGLAAWASARLAGEEVSLASRAPRLARVLHATRPYTQEEFLGLCGTGDAATVSRVLQKQPDILDVPDGGIPFIHRLATRDVSGPVLRLIMARLGPEAVNAPDAEGRSALHVLVSRASRPEAVIAFIGDLDEGAVNARDAKGRTALHLAAASPVAPAVVLALRGKGANPVLRDKAGDTPLDILLQTWGGMPREVTGEEKGKFGTFGFTMRPFASGRDGRSATKFVSIGSLVDDTELKRYFTLVAEARVTVRKDGSHVPDMAVGDMVTRPTDPLVGIMRGIGGDAISRLSEFRRAKGTPLWKAVKLEKGTGAAVAKLKCLLPEAYPASLNYFSTMLTQGKDEPSLGVEWSGWDVPPGIRLAIMLQALQKRVNAGKGTGGTTPGQRFDPQSVALTEQERGDAPGARNPLLMTLLLLDTAPAQAKTAVLNENPLPPAGSGGKNRPSSSGSSGKGANMKELPNLVALRAALPRDIWRKVGHHLVAAAYVADKTAEGDWGAYFMPARLKKARGLKGLRTWGAKDAADASEPMTNVLAVCGEVPPGVAAAMVALLLRSGPESMAADKNGRTPLEVAREYGAPDTVLAMLQSAPPPPDAAYVPPPNGGTKPAVPVTRPPATAPKGRPMPRT